MKRMLLGMAVCVVCVTWTAARDDKAGTADTDATFVYKASAGGLAEVNLGRVAAKQAASADVKKFAQMMVDDHTKANEELLALANKLKLKAAPRMDAEHEKLNQQLLKLTAVSFDKEYMTGQVKDHEETVALFEKQAKNGSNDELKKWADKKLPTLREHLEMARKVQSKLKDSSTAKDK